MLCDPLVCLVPRAIDQRWRYERVLPVSLTGFNPFLWTLFYASNSALTRWLADPYGSARDYNEDDTLVREVLFALHDYLHCWSAEAIAVLAPWLRFDIPGLLGRPSRVALPERLGSGRVGAPRPPRCGRGVARGFHPRTGSMM